MSSHSPIPLPLLFTLFRSRGEVVVDSSEGFISVKLRKQTSKYRGKAENIRANYAILKANWTLKSCTLNECSIVCVMSTFSFFKKKTIMPVLQPYTESKQQQNIINANWMAFMCFMEQGCCLNLYIREWFGQHMFQPFAHEMHRMQCISN